MKTRIHIFLSLIAIIAVYTKANATYILTDADVVVSNGIITSCSYSFDDTDIVIPTTLDGQTVTGIKDGYRNTYGVFYNKGITSVVLPASLQNIGDYAFYNNQLTSVSIPATVTRIGNSAFYGNNLASLTIPSGVEQIITSAFNSNSLTSVTFQTNSNIRYIGYNAFLNNAGLTSVTLPVNANGGFIEYVDHNGTIFAESATFSTYNAAYFANFPYTLTNANVNVSNGLIRTVDLDNYVNIIIPSTLDGQTVTAIEDANSSSYGVFKGNLVAVVLPSSIINIGKYAFYGNNIRSLTIPNSVTRVGEYAFSDNALTTVTFTANSNIRSIEDNAFKSNTGLASITLPTSAYGGFINYVDEAGTTFAEGATFSSFETYYHANIPYTLTDDDVTVKDGIITACTATGYINLTIPSTLDGQTITGIGNGKYTSTYYPHSGTFSYRYVGIFGEMDLISVALPATIQTIGTYAFMKNRLASVSIPSTIKMIDDYAFYNNSLTSVSFAASSNLLRINEFVFAVNSGLASITMPSNSNAGFINYKDFDGNSYAVSGTITDFDIHYYADVPYTLTDDDAFVFDGQIESVDYNPLYLNIIVPGTLDGQTVTGIKSGAYTSQSVFYNKNITKISLPSTIEKIGDNAFYNNNILTITLPASLTEIGNNAFKDNNLGSISIPNTVTQIGISAFENNKLTTVTLSDSVTIIEKNTFKNNQIASVTIPKAVSKIGSSAFNTNLLTSVTFEANSHILLIKEDAFSGNGGLANITLPTNDNAGFIEYKDAYNNTYNEGDIISDFTSIYFVNKVPYTLTDDDVIVVSGVLETCTYDFSNTNIQIPDVLDGQTITGIAGGDYKSAVFMQKDITSVVLPSSLETIGKYAFSNNNIINITLPVTISVIGERAFQSNQLNTVIFESNSNLMLIERYAFLGNPNLGSIQLPANASIDFNYYRDDNGDIFNEYENITNFGILYYADIPFTLTDANVVVYKGVIRKCNYSSLFRNIIIPETLDGQTVVGIAEGLFASRNIVSLQLPSTLTSIGKNVFKQNKLVSIIIPEGVTDIGYEAFGYNSLSSISLPSSLKTIGQYAFRYNQLTSVTIPASVIDIDNRAFNNNDLRDVIFEANSSITRIDEYVFSWNSNLTSIELPTNSNPGFTNYKDNSGTDYAAESSITVFTNKVYTANFPYTLTDDDVVVNEGIIESYSKENYANIIIPDTLDGQQVTGIADASSSSLGVFYEKNLLEVQLPSTLKFIGNNAFGYNPLNTINLPAGLNRIGSQAFYYCNLSSSLIPSSVNLVGAGSFRRNYGLNNLTFESNSKLISIEYQAFYETALTSVTLPSNVNDGFTNYKDVETNVYNPGESITNFSTTYYVDSIYTLTDADVVVNNGIIEQIIPFPFKSIIIPEILNGQTVTGIADGGYTSGVFYNLALKSVQFPSTLKTIGAYAFRSNKLTSVTLPPSLTKIANNAFWLNNITDVSMPSSLVEIGNSAFESNKIGSLIIPVNVKSIGTSAFGSNLLTGVTFENNSLISIIMNGAFKNNTGLTSITLPSNATNGFTQYIGYNDSIYIAGDEITDFNISYYVDLSYTLKDADVVVENGVITSYTGYEYPKIVIPETLDGQTITGIGDDLFDGATLISVDLPSSLLTIGEYAFYGVGITNIVFPDGLISIDQYAFSDNKLTSLILPNSITTINEEAFARNELTSVTLPNNLKVLSNELFIDNKLASITIPNSVETIVRGAFYSNELTEITIPNSVKIIDQLAFYDNLLTTVVIPNSVTEIYWDAFKNNNLTDVTFEANSNIAYLASPFGGNDNINPIIFPTHASPSFTSYKDNFYSYAEGDVIENLNTTYYTDFVHTLTDFDVVVNNGIIESFNSYEYAYKKIIIPDTLDGQRIIGIADDVFNNYNFTELTLPATIQSIGAKAFYSNRLESVTFEENSYLAFIGENAFAQNTDLTGITLPQSAIPSFTQYFDLTGQTYNAGDIMDDFATVYYADITYTLADDDVIVTNGTIEQCNYLVYKKIVIPSTLDGQTVTGIANGVFTNLDIVEVTFPTSLKTIGNKAFANNKLTKIDIPEGVKGLGDEAFKDNQITKVSFESNSNIIYLGQNLFVNNNEGLTYVRFPVNVTPNFIEYSDQYGGTYIENDKITDFFMYYYVNTPYTLTDNDVVVSNGVIQSCSYGFEYKNIVIPTTLDGQEVTGIADGNENSGVFANKNIVSVNLPTSLQNIGNCAFYNNKLISVQLRNKTKLVGDSAFAGNNIIALTLPETSIAGFNFVNWNGSLDANTQVTDFEIPYEANLTTTVYTLTFMPNGGTHANTTTQYTAGTDTIKLLDAVKTGFVFDGWYTDESFTTKVTEIVKGNYGNKVFYAKYTLEDYSITYNNSGVHTNPGSYNFETALFVFNSASKQGYTFNGWYLDSTLTTQITEVPQGSSGNLNLWASFTENVYTITYNLSGGANNANNPASFTINDSTIVLADGSYAEHVFNGWYTDSLFTNQIIEIPKGSMSNVQVWAKFSIINYNIAYNLNGGVNSETNPLTFNVNSAFIFSDATKAGYSFTGWFTDSTLVTQLNEIAQGSTGNLTLWAGYAPAQYSITYNLGGGANDSLNPASYTFGGDTISLLGATQSGYNFIGWFSDSNFVSPVQQIPTGSTGDIELFAKYAPISYSIIYNLNGGVNNESNLTIYTIANDTIFLKQATKSGYVFSGWYTDAEYTTMVTNIPKGSMGNIALFAAFVPKQYSISYNLGVGVNDSANPAIYSIETDTIFLKQANAQAYLFDGWYSNIELTDTVIEIAKGSMGNIELWAKFTPIEYTIDYNLNGGINNALNPTTYNTETEVVFGNAQKTGYSFDAWYTDSLLSEVISGIPVDTFGGFEVWANFNPVEYSITYNLNGGVNNESNPSVYTIETATISIADALREGYDFAGWFTDIAFTEPISEIPEGTIGNIELWAKYKVKTYAVSFAVTNGTNAIANALMNFNGTNYVTNTSGEVSITEVPNGLYSYTVVASGYDSFTGMVTIDGSNVEKEILLVAATNIANGLENEVRVYPNPAFNKISIQVSSNAQQVCIFDNNGSIVYLNSQIEPLTKMLEVDVSGFKQGIYYVVMDDYIEKIIKK